jgi:hypothetical protein
VAGWLGGVVGILRLLQDVWEVGLRDVGLLLAALALARLAGTFRGPRFRGTPA